MSWNLYSTTPAIERFTLVRRTDAGSIVVKQYAGTKTIRKQHGLKFFFTEDEMRNYVNAIAARSAPMWRNHADQLEAFAKAPTVRVVPDKNITAGPIRLK